MTHVEIAPRPAPRLPRAVRRAGVVALVLMVAGLFLLMGLPGAIYGSLAVWLVELLRGFPLGSVFQGDRAWPLFILLTLLVPPALPLGLWLGLRWFAGRLWPALALALAAVWLWTVIVLLVLTAGL